MADKDSPGIPAEPVAGPKARPFIIENVERPAPVRAIHFAFCAFNGQKATASLGRVMKDIVAIEVHCSRRQVAMLLANPDNMTKWMHDLAAYEHIGGETGAVGARYGMVSKPGTQQSASSRR